MIQIRKSTERGHFNHGWLKSYHTFSFADYYDPRHMQFGPIRVINEDFIEGGKGFPTHPHHDMEIITYPIDGAIAHKDSTGSSGVILPYEVQKMTAGRGIRHSEHNHLENEETHLLQIWILPNKQGLSPAYEQRNFKEAIFSGQEVLLASPTGEGDSLLVNQDLKLSAKKNRENEIWSRNIEATRKYWIQIVKGELVVEGPKSLSHPALIGPGDALAITEESQIKLLSKTDSEFLFFDMTGDDL